ncbi:MAG: DnaA ATPase domain-containing protein [Metamycoplasmataceae bacterium]
MDIREIKKQVLSNKKIVKLIEDNKLNDKQIEESLLIFFDIIQEDNDKDLLYTSEIEVKENGMVLRKMIPTEIGKKIENLNNFFLRDVTFVDHSLILAKNDKQEHKENEFTWNENRKELLHYFNRVILKNFKDDNYFKGVYLYGDFGVGKSFFTQAVANYFASKNKTVAYINNNDLANHLKQLFSVGYKKTIDTLKEVDFLFIDDIGSEKNSSWMVSEILFSILSHRMQMKKTTFFTSNFSYKQLEKEFIKGTEVSGFKAKRLMERIEVLSTPILLKGNNWRKL